MNVIKLLAIILSFQAAVQAVYLQEQYQKHIKDNNHHAVEGIAREIRAKNSAINLKQEDEKSALKQPKEEEVNPLRSKELSNPQKIATDINDAEKNDKLFWLKSKKRPTL